MATSSPLRADHSGAPPHFLMNNTPVTTCHGIFLDSGGEASTYGSFEVFTKTFTPIDPTSQKLRVAFTLFDLEHTFGLVANPFDSLEIFDGGSTSAPSLGKFFLREDFATGDIIGGMEPETITSTAVDGSLTFRFVSDSGTERDGWSAGVSCAQAYNPVFTTSGQSLWGSGTAATLPDSQHFEFFTQNFAGPTSSSSIQNLLGSRFGAAVGSGIHTDLGLRVQVRDIEPGSVDITYPTQVSFSNSPADSFRPGDTVRIDTFGRIRAEAGPSLRTVTPNMTIELDARITYAASVAAEVCFFDCVSVDVLAFAGLPSMHVTGSDNILSLNPDAGQVEVLDLTVAVGGTPFTIPGAAATLTGVSGIVDTPNLGLPNSPVPTTIQGTALVAGGSHHFLDLAIDMDQWMTRAPGVPKGANFALESPGPVPFTPPGPPGSTIDWLLLDYDVEVDLTQQFNFTFAPKQQVKLEFRTPGIPVSPRLPVQFQVFRDGIAIQAATATSVTIDPGDSVELVVPDDVVMVQPTFVLTETTFFNENTTRFERAKHLRALETTMTLPGIDVGTFGPICTPLFCIGPFTVAFPQTSYHTGPLVDVTDPEPPNNDPRLFGVANRQFPMLGFDAQVHPPFFIDPEFQPVAVIDGPSAPVNEGDVVLFSASQSTDRDNTPLTYTWDFGDDGSGIGPTTGENVTHRFGDNGVFLVTLTVDDGHGQPGIAQMEVTVLNVSPSQPGPVPADQTVEEGELALIAPGTTDPGFLDTFLSEGTWGDSTSFLFDSRDFLIFDPVEPIGHFYADDGVYDVDYCVTDDDGAQVCGDLTITATNAAPTVSVADFDLERRALDLGRELETSVRATALFSDPGTLDTHTAVLRWGDGSPDSPLSVVEAPFGPPGAQRADGFALGDVTHAYTSSGNYDLEVCVGDDDGAETCATATTLDVPEADLEITKTVVPAQAVPVPVGDILTYTLEVTNNGPDPIDDVRVTDVLPANTRLVSAVRGGDGSIETKLSPGDLATNSERDASFGESLAISGDTIVVGARLFLDAFGAAYVYQADGADWNEIQKLAPSDGALGDLLMFGHAVAVENDTMVVTAPNALNGPSGVGIATGAAYVFRFDGTRWSEIAKLVPGDGTADDAFGASVGISGDTVVVGTPTRNAVYVFERNLGGRDSWGQLVKLESPSAGPGFGQDVSISGDTLVVAAPGSLAGPVAGGSATLFRGIGIWAQEAQLTEANVGSVQETNTFAGSVAIHGDTLVVGTREQAASLVPGAAHIFQRDGVLWTEQAKLEARDSTLGDLFGRSVAIDGDAVLIGAPGADKGVLPAVGAAYVFDRTGTDWKQRARLAPSIGEATDRFGTGVGIDGETLVGGAPNVEELTPPPPPIESLEVGAAFVFATCPENPTNTVICGLGTMASGDSLLVQIEARIGCALAVASGTSLTNTATVAGLGIDPSPADNTDAVTSTTALPPMGVCGADLTPPSIDAVVRGTLGDNGWYTSSIDVAWLIHDPDSAITSQTGCDPTLFNTDTTSTDFACIATSSGGTATETVTLARDATPPTIGPNISGAVGNAGWYTSDVTVTFDCTDATSGLATCEGGAVLTDEGAHPSLLSTAVDLAGNSASATVTGILIDKTPPIVTTTQTPAGNANGWNDGPVTVDVSCQDALSGLAICDPLQTVFATEGADQGVVVATEDVAGNTSETTVNGINVDLTPPTISAVAEPPANANGWRNSIVTVRFDCQDAISGVASCTEDTFIDTEGQGLSATGTVVDLAGHSQTTSVSGIDIDFTPPAITATASPLPGPDGLSEPPVTVSFTCTDDRSGLANCPPDIVLADVGFGQTAEGTASDRAGNTATAVIHDIHIGRPTVSAAGSQAIDEGELLTLVLASVDPLLATTGVATVDWGDGSGADAATLSSRGSSGDISGSHVYADDGVYQVLVCVENLLRIEVCDQLQVDVSNQAPTISAAMVPVNPVEFDVEARLIVDFGDPGTADTHRAEIDWGDGSALEVATVIEAPFGPPGDTGGSSGQLQADHLYPTPGAYVGEVCIVDESDARDCENFSLTAAEDGPLACHVVVGQMQCTDQVAAVPLEVILENSRNQPALFLWSSDNPNGVFDDLINNDFGDPTSQAPTLVTHAPGGFNVMAEAAFSDESGLGSVICQHFIPACGVSDLSLVKMVDNDMPLVSETVVFTLTVTNEGPDDATGVIVSDELPIGLGFVASAGGGTYDPQTGLWTIGALPAGDSISLDIMATADVAGEFVNVAGVEASGQGDPDSEPANDDGDQSEDDEDNSTLTVLDEPTAIPTLGEWGLIFFVGLLLLAGCYQMLSLRTNPQGRG